MVNNRNVPHSQQAFNLSADNNKEKIKENQNLDLKFDLACENNVYTRYQKERLCLHEAKCRYETNQKQGGSNDVIETMVIYIF